MLCGIRVQGQETPDRFAKLSMLDIDGDEVP
jgi:hypothetical protein